MNIQKLKHEIFSAISLCSYPPNITDSLIELIIQIMTYSHVKSNPHYKIKTVNQEKIIAVRCPMDVPFNKRNYEVPIVIFISKMFPLEPPKILLEVSKGSAINPKTRDVDINTRKIITPSLRSWNRSSNIINILNEIRNSFSAIFPIYKMKKSQTSDKIDINNNNYNIRNDNYDNIKTSNTININNNAIFNFVNNNNINNDKMNNNSSSNNNNDLFANIASIFTENFINNPNNNGFNFTFNNNGIQNMNNNIMNLKYQNNDIINNKKTNVININNINNMNNFNVNQMYEKENKIKNILIEAVFDKISTKLINEYKKLNQQNKTLNNYKNQFKTENERMEKYIIKKQEITNECTKNLYHLNNEITKYQEYIKKKKDYKVTENNCLQFIKIDNPKVLRAIAKEIMYEDLIVMIKKGFEKKQITFQEAISSTRDAARDLFISKVIREKGLKEI